MENAIRSNNIPQVIYLFNNGFRPTQEEVDLASRLNYFNILNFFTQHNIYPSSYYHTFGGDGAQTQLDLNCASTREFFYDPHCRNIPSPDTIRKQYPDCFQLPQRLNPFGDCAKIRTIEEKERIKRGNPDCDFKICSVPRETGLKRYVAPSSTESGCYVTPKEYIKPTKECIKVMKNIGFEWKKWGDNWSFGPKD